MLWKQEITERGIAWAFIWNDSKIRTITHALRNTVWSLIRTRHPVSQEHTSLDSDADSSLEDEDIMRYITPPRVPSTKPVRSSSLLDWMRW